MGSYHASFSISQTKNFTDNFFHDTRLIYMLPRWSVKWCDPVCVLLKLILCSEFSLELTFIELPSFPRVVTNQNISEY